MTEHKVLFVEWCAKDALDGTQQMDPMTELAYRRVLDMIYATNDDLLDDDKVLQYSTKTGPKWRAIKKALIEVHKKIYVENGKIRNAVCTKKLEKSRANIEQKSIAGKSSAEARKALKDNETGSTAVETSVATAEPTGVPTNQEPNNQLKESPLPPSGEKVSRGTKPPPRPVADDSGFAEFWAAYPSDEGETAARTQFLNQIMFKGADPAQMTRAAKAYARKCAENKIEPKFVTHAKKWLHEQYYLDAALNVPEPKAISTEDMADWQRAIAAEIGPAQTAAWFGNAEWLAPILKMPSKFSAERVTNDYLPALRRALGSNIQIVHTAKPAQETAA